MVLSPAATRDSGTELTGRDRTRSIVLFCAGISFFWAALYIYVPILPVYATSLGASLTVVGLAVGIYGFIQLPERIPLGAWSDHIGKRKPFVVLGIVAVAAGCLVMVWGPNPWFLVVGRTVVGMGAATWLCATVLFSGYFAPHQAVKAMGLATFFCGAPQALVGILGGWLADSYSLSTPFYVGAVLGVVGLLLMLGVKEPPVKTTQSMSWARFRRISTVPLLIVVSVVGALSFFSFYATTFSFTPVYATGLGASGTELGILMSITMTSYSIATLAAFRLTNLFSDRWVVIGSMLAGALSIVVTPIIGELWLLMMVQVFSGVARGLVYPVLMGLSLRAVEPEDRATSAGIFQATYSLGMFLGPFLGGTLADSAGLTSVFLIAGLASLLGAGLGLWIVAQHRQAREAAAS